MIVITTKWVAGTEFDFGEEAGAPVRRASLLAVSTAGVACLLYIPFLLQLVLLFSISINMIPFQLILIK